MAFHASNDFFSVLKLLFDTIWRIVVSFNIPGTNINSIEFVFGVMVIIFVLKHGIAFAFGVADLSHDISKKASNSKGD